MASNVIPFRHDPDKEYPNVEIEKAVLMEYLEHANKAPANGLEGLVESEEACTGVIYEVEGKQYEVFDPASTVLLAGYTLFESLPYLDPDFLLDNLKQGVIPHDDNGIAIIKAIQAAGVDGMGMWSELIPLDIDIFIYAAVKRYGIKRFIAEQEDTVTPVIMAKDSLFWVVEKGA